MRGAHSFETSPPADIKADVDIGKSSYVSSAFVFRVLSPNETSLPWLRREASATTSSAGKARSARISSRTCPTLPGRADNGDLITHLFQAPERNALPFGGDAAANDLPPAPPAGRESSPRRGSVQRVVFTRVPVKHVVFVPREPETALRAGHCGHLHARKRPRRTPASALHHCADRSAILPFLSRIKAGARRRPFAIACAN